MKTKQHPKKIPYLYTFIIIFSLVGFFYFFDKLKINAGASQKATEQGYTNPEIEDFILNALLNVKRSPPQKTVFELYETPSISDIDWSPQEKSVFKFPEAVSVGFGWSRKNILSSPHVYQRGGTPGRVYETFYEPLEKELREFLPQLEEVMGLDMRFVNAAEEIAGEEKNNVKIRIIADRGFTQWIDGKPVFQGTGPAAFTKVFIHDDPRLRDDVVTFNVLSPFLRGYAYFDQEHNLTWVVCQMWMYMGSSDRRDAMRECIVRALGVVGEIKGQEHFQYPKLPDILKKTLSFLYCSEVRGGMHREEILGIIRKGGCL